jgi:predicted dehydrogenase
MALGENIRLGIVGCRRGGSYASVAQALPGVHVTAVMDVSEDAAKVLAQAASVTAVFTDYQRFLAEAPLDAVVIASPIQFHAEQAIAALDRKLHVLSEVPACHSLESARALADAAARSQAAYMFAENCCYFDEVELVRRMARAGSFGDLSYGEAEYLHDCRYLWRDASGQLTWRGRGLEQGGLYITHSLGPLLEIFADQVTHVSCLGYGSTRVYDPEVNRPAGHTVLMHTLKGAALKVRVDTTSPRPHATHFYLVQGTAGTCESARGLGDRAKVWLAREHGESHVHGRAAWHDLFAGYAQQFIPERLAVSDEARRGGHGTSEYWLLQDFLRSIREGTKPPIDAYRGLDYTVPGIVARQSAEQGGVLLPVPDFRPKGAAS